MNVRILLFFFLFCLVTDHCLYSQAPNENSYKFEISRIDDDLVIDGNLDESAWQAAEILESFKQNFPYDTSFALHQTKVKVIFDDEFLYISAVCYQKDFIVRSLRRDYENSSTDIFTVLIDPFRDKLNGYYFAVSPYGVQKEQLIYNGNETNVNWDNKWYSEVKRYEDRFEVEMAIPFKTLRYEIKPGKNIWNINFFRNNNYDNERSCWAPIPRNFRLLDINFNGSMAWPTAPPKPGSNVVIIPFIAKEVHKNYLANSPTKTRNNLGLDAKIGVTSSLNLDMTINPDFSQVEVDRQITDLSRFELFFPERRQFFLENSDLFSEYGTQNTNPFFSRRIGIYYNPTSKENVQVPIIAGARLSGRLNENWRIGLINMQTDKNIKDSIPIINYSVSSIQRKIGTRSNLSFLIVNKETFIDNNSNKSLLPYNRVLGLEYNYGSSDGSITGKAFYHQVFTPRQINEEYNMGFNLNILKSYFQLGTGFLNVGNNYLAEVGYVPRTGIIRNNANLSFIIFPKGKLSSLINSFRITPDYDVIYRKLDERITDLDAGLFFSVQFQNNAELSGALLRWDYTYLFSDFDPTNKYDEGFNILKKGTDYFYFSNRISFRSNYAKRFNYNIQARVGQYFNGNIVSLQSSLSYRWQPYVAISTDINYNRIRMPQGYNNADFWLLGPRLDLTLTKELFFTTLVQYNNQNNNVNINSRFQWRFKPVSDLFIVYTDNYYAQDDPKLEIFGGGKKNRALIAKLTYWLNI